MDPLAFLGIRDEAERSLMLAIANAALALEEKRDLNRATMIANAVGKMLNGEN